MTNPLKVSIKCIWPLKVKMGTRPVCEIRIIFLSVYKLKSSRGQNETDFQVNIKAQAIYLQLSNNISSLRRMRMSTDRLKWLDQSYSIALESISLTTKNSTIWMGIFFHLLCVLYVGIWNCSVNRANTDYVLCQYVILHNLRSAIQHYYLKTKVHKSWVFDWWWCLMSLQFDVVIS